VNDKKLFSVGCLILTLLFVSRQSQAEHIYFGNANLGPDNILILDDVAVSSGNVMPGLPSTVAGAGLGSDLIGPADSIDQLYHFNAGSLSGHFQWESLCLSVPGTINSITVVPKITIQETGKSPPLTFQIMSLYYNASGTLGTQPAWSNVTGDGNAVTLLCPYSSASGVEIGVQGNGGEFLFLSSEQIAAGLPEATYQMSLTIEAIDYTPVPEPSTGLLSSVLAIVFGLQRIGFRRSRKSAA
jgi:hypothetical protein